MEDIHTPSSSTQASTSIPPPTAPLKTRLNSLLSRRSLLEAQLESSSSILKLNDSTMSTPLIDPQGFPRSDIDVAQVRTARVAIIRGRNDLKDLERELEGLVREGLERKEGDVEEETGMEVEKKEEEREELKPFAKVNSVAPNSPAQTAGLEASDLILSLSSINHSNHENLSKVGQLVSTSEGKELELVVMRGSEKRTLKLVPRSGWGGRGLLGCHIVPYP